MCVCECVCARGGWGGVVSGFFKYIALIERLNASECKILI